LTALFVPYSLGSGRRVAKKGRYVDGAALGVVERIEGVPQLHVPLRVRLDLTPTHNLIREHTRIICES
jgi:hypothetical protein